MTDVCTYIRTSYIRMDVYITPCLSLVANQTYLRVGSHSCILAYSASLARPLMNIPIGPSCMSVHFQSSQSSTGDLALGSKCNKSSSRAGGARALWLLASYSYSYALLWPASSTTKMCKGQILHYAESPILDAVHLKKCTLQENFQSLTICQL